MFPLCLSAGVHKYQLMKDMQVAGDCVYVIASEQHCVLMVARYAQLYV